MIVLRPQVRDISTNVAWQNAMHSSVPVLKVLATDADGNPYEVSAMMVHFVVTMRAGIPLMHAEHVA